MEHKGQKDALVILVMSKIKGVCEWKSLISPKNSESLDIFSWNTREAVSFMRPSITSRRLWLCRVRASLLKCFCAHISQSHNKNTECPSCENWF